MDIQSEVKTIIKPYCSLSNIVRTEKQDEPIIMNSINIIPFGNVNTLQFGLHEIPRLIVCKSLTSIINITTVCLEAITYYGVYGLPLGGNIRNSYKYKGIYNKRKNANLRKKMLLGSPNSSSLLKEMKIQKKYY